MGEFKYEIDPNFDFVLEEKANTYMSLRKIKWGESADFKLDLRKYQTTESGDERMLKGCTFISNEGAHELTKVLLEQGYGYTEDIVDAIATHRPKVLTSLINKTNDTDGSSIEITDKNDSREFFDLRDIV